MVAALAVAYCQLSLAADGTWTGSDPGFLWGTAANWNPGPAPDATGAVATFNLASPTAVHLDATRTLGTLNFTTGGWTIDNNSTPANLLTLAIASGSPTITTTSGTDTISANLAGTAGLTKSGARNADTSAAPTRFPVACKLAKAR